MAASLEAVYNVLNYKHFVEGKKLNDTFSFARLLLPLPVPTTKLVVIFLQLTAASRRLNRRRLFCEISASTQFQLLLSEVNMLYLAPCIPLSLSGSSARLKGQGTALRLLFQADALQIPINLRGVTLPPPTGSLWI